MRSMKTGFILECNIFIILILKMLLIKCNCCSNICEDVDTCATEVVHINAKIPVEQVNSVSLTNTILTVYLRYTFNCYL